MPGLPSFVFDSGTKTAVVPKRNAGGALVGLGLMWEGRRVARLSEIGGTLAAFLRRREELA
jgi:hypothetical protein